MRVLLDMGLSPQAAEFLRESGIDAVHLFELDLVEWPMRKLSKRRQESRESF
jgi:hypothetical protein